MKCLANYSHVSVADGATCLTIAATPNYFLKSKRPIFCWICLCLQRINKPVCMEMWEEAWREPPQPTLSELLRELLRYRALETSLLCPGSSRDLLLIHSKALTPSGTNTGLNWGRLRSWRSCCRSTEILVHRAEAQPCSRHSQNEFIQVQQCHGKVIAVTTAGGLEVCNSWSE